MIKKLIAIVYERHIMTPHAADFEVCSDWLCRLCVLLEKATQ